MMMPPMMAPGIEVKPPRMRNASALCAMISYALESTALQALPFLILGGSTPSPGDILGGVIIGVGEKFGEFYWGPLLGSGIESWLAYVIALVFLLFRPQGLFGERIIERL